MEQTSYKLSFAALDPYWVSSIPNSIETSTPRGVVTWGSRNDYPEYLWSLYNNVTALKSVIDTMTSYICGTPTITGKDPQELLNSKGDTFDDIINMCIKDYVIYGGFALNILRNKYNGVAEVHYMDFKNLRTNEDHTEFYYSDSWGSKSNGRVKFITYPAFGSNKPNEIFYYSSSYNTVYPVPIYASAIPACEIEKRVNEFHLNSLSNSFMGSAIINMNSGIPSDEQKAEIEDNFYEKFCGTGNAGQPVLSWNDSKDHEVTISKIDTNDFSDRYNALAKRSREEILTAFRINANLLGISTENIGFSKEEYEQTFKIYNTTVIKPIQRIIIKQLNKIFGEVNIYPFKIDWEE